MFYSSVHRSETGRPRHGCNSLLICREATCEYVHSEIGLYTCVCVCVEGGGGGGGFQCHVRAFVPAQCRLVVDK